jgi:hypothetical protein
LVGVNRQVPGRLDEATRELGQRKLAELRMQMHRRRLGADGNRVSDAAFVGPALTASPAERSPRAEASVEAMVAEMALGAERERLERRVVALEAEVAQLRAVIGASIQTLAAGLSGGLVDARPTDDWSIMVAVSTWVSEALWTSAAACA